MSAELEPVLMTLAPVSTVVIRETVPTSELQATFDRGFRTINAALRAQGITVTGPAFGCYHGGVAETVDVELGFPTESPVGTDGEVRAGEVRAGELPGGRAATAVHVGGYDGLAAAWQRFHTWIADHGLTPGPDMWEIYEVEPRPDMDPADLRTTLVWPVTD